jgi:hypothetical protein
MGQSENRWRKEVCGNEASVNEVKGNEVNRKIGGEKRCAEMR